MIVLDSSGWLEYLADGPRADKYQPYFENLYELITPTVVVYEVYKKVKQERDEKDAAVILAYFRATNIEPLNEKIAVSAAEISISKALPMADAIVYATALFKGVGVVTSDKHFEGLEGVIFIT